MIGLRDVFSRAAGALISSGLFVLPAELDLSSDDSYAPWRNAANTDQRRDLVLLSNRPRQKQPGGDGGP